jgi:hypothetical protein
MACKRSAVRSRLPPPKVRDETPSSRGLGPRPFTAVTGVRFPLGSPKQKRHPCDGVFVLRSPRGPIEPLGSTTQCPVDIALDAARVFSRRARQGRGKRRGNPFSEHSLFCVVRFRAILCCFFCPRLLLDVSRVIRCAHMRRGVPDRVEPGLRSWELARPRRAAASTYVNRRPRWRHVPNRVKQPAVVRMCPPGICTPSTRVPP